MIRCVFFDRDGIVNTSPGPGYVQCVQDFHIQPAFIKAAAIARDSGYEIAIATNQRGVARGIMSQQDLNKIHEYLIGQLQETNISLLGIYCCTHERNTCTCRKPQPGLLLQAASEKNIDLRESWMIGDKETDVEAGRQAGCQTVLVTPTSSSNTRANHVISSIDALPRLFENLLARSTR